MKEKIIKILDYIINLVLLLILSISLIECGMYREMETIKYIVSFGILIILFLIKFLIKPYKLNKKYLLYLLFGLTFIIPIIFKSSYLFYETITHTIFIFLTILLGIVISEQYKNKKETFYKIIILSTLICSIISFGSFFFETEIVNKLGDFYKSSVDRLYGTLMYPNALGLMNIIGIILSFSLLSKKKIYFIPFYINLFVFSLTISKSLFLFIIVAFIFLIYKYRKNAVYLLSLIPLVYNVKIYRNAIMNNDFMLLIIVTIICIIISYLLVLWYKKHKLSLGIVLLSLLLILTISPYQNLTVKPKKDSLTILTDFMYLEENTDYILHIEADGDIDKSQFFIYKWYLKNNNLTSDIAGFTFMEEVNDIKFNTGENFEYFTLNLVNKSEELTFKNIKLYTNNYEKEIRLDYKYYPYNYIKLIEQTKYDVGSVSGRKTIYKDALNLIKEKPLTGYGYKYFNEKTIQTNPSHKAVEEHSYILTLSVENGIISALVWIIILSYTYYLLLRNIKDENGITYFLVISAIVFSSLYDFTLSYNWFLLIFISFSMMLENKKNKELLLICSAGGHLTAMMKLDSIFKNKDYVLITEKNSLSKNLKNYNLEYVIYCSKHYLLHYILVTPINIIKYIFYFIYYNPKVILTTGSHTGVFMCYLGKLFRKKIIYIEVYDRYKTLTLSGRMVYKIADTFIVQHQSLLDKYPKATYIGGMY